MEDHAGNLFDLAKVILAVVGVIVAILFLYWWKTKTDGGGPAPLQGRKVEAEILDAPSSLTPPVNNKQTCRACGTQSSPGGWRRPSAIGVMGGFVGWTRRLRGLPPLYTLIRPAFIAEDHCVDCSHVRDARVDEEIMKANLAIYTISRQIATEVQRFMTCLDDELREMVTASDKRKRLPRNN